MECKHFGICGSCNFYNESYEEQLKIKEHKLKIGPVQSLGYGTKKARLFMR
ncbi:MAG: hypothetical protein P8Y35_02635 [Sulfurovaceae bacterium]